MENMANPHSAEELAQLSTLVHNVFGWLLVLLCLVMLYETFRGIPDGRSRLVWPAIGLTMGVGLVLFIWLHFTLGHKISPLLLPMQKQHLAIGAVTAFGSLFELLRRLKVLETKAWEAAFPGALVAVGAAFLLHEQATVQALIVHWALGGSIVLAGMILGSVVLGEDKGKALRVLGILILTAAAAQLVFFREKPGEHKAHGAADSTLSDPDSEGSGQTDMPAGH